MRLWPPPRGVLSAVIDRLRRHLLALISELLNFTRVSTEGVTYDIGPVDLGAVMMDIASMIEAQIVSKGLSYKVRTPAEVCLVLADADKLRQVLLNLLTNAMKCTPAGGHVATDVNVGAASVALLRVRDDGIGIAPKKHEAIFQAFVQIDGR